MAYVDLNPIRAAMANTPENSDYTSIQERLGIAPSIAPTKDTTEPLSQATTKPSISRAPLLAFAGDEHQNNSSIHIPFHFTDYLELVDWTGRILRSDKRGAIHHALPPILTRLGICPERWLHNCNHLGKDFHRAIGPIAKLEQLCEKLNQRWLKGASACRLLYSA